MNRLRVVHAVVDVERTDLLHLLLGQLELGDLEVLRETRRVVALRDDRESLLERPAEEDLSFSCGHACRKKNNVSVLTARKGIDNALLPAS